MTQPTTVTVTVHALESGQLTIPEAAFVAPADPAARMTVPSLSFLIQHVHPSSGTTTRMLFDLGLRHPLSLYSPQIQAHIAKRQPATSAPDVLASLARGGLRAEDVGVVVLSHVHWDHIGDPARFPHARFVVGPGSLGLLDGTASSGPGSHSAFERGILPMDRTTQLPAPQSGEYVVLPLGGSRDTLSRWERFENLPHTLDVFGDGAVRIVHAPGHVPGHINLLVRIAERKYIYLAGDAAHDRRIYYGTKEIATWTEEGTGERCCIHSDRDAAMGTLALMRALEENGVEDGRAAVQVIFAHDVEWVEKARKEEMFWPGRIV